MARFKDFESTGLAPNGRLYAGDLNAIQDMKADLSNFSQNVDVAQVRIGETGLQLLRHGALEARMTGALRTDGIVRGLGGGWFGQFTTTQRDAIPTGFRPFGLVIFNVTSGRLEINIGTDATPDWRSVALGVGPGDMQPGQGGFLPAGAIVSYGGAVAPSGFLLCDGALYLQADYPALFAAISTSFNTGGETGAQFRVPNFKGRIPAGRDAAQSEFSTLGQIGGVKTHPLVASEMPSHNHAVNAHSHTVNSHNHGGGYHSHGGATWNAGAHSHGATGSAAGSFAGTDGRVDTAGGSARQTVTGQQGIAGVGDHAHGIGAEWTVGAESPGTDAQAPGTNWKGGVGAPQSDGAGGAHNNLQPYLTVNRIIKT